MFTTRLFNFTEFLSTERPRCKTYLIFDFSGIFLVEATLIFLAIITVYFISPEISENLRFVFRVT